MTKQPDCARRIYSRVDPILGLELVQDVIRPSLMFLKRQPESLLSEAGTFLLSASGFHVFPTEESEESPDNFARYGRRMQRVHTLPEMTPGRVL